MASFFSFPFFPSLSHPPSLLGTFQAAPLLHLLLFTFSSPPQPRSLSESGRPRCRHSPPGDYRHKGGLGGHGCSRSTRNATGERERRKVPPPRPIPFSPPSSPPPQMMKTLSVWIRKERCVSVEGITVIKAVAQDLYMSTPLSTYSLFVTLYQFWDSEPFHAVVTLPNCCYAFDFFYSSWSFNGILFSFCECILMIKGKLFMKKPSKNFSDIIFIGIPDSKSKKQRILL